MVGEPYQRRLCKEVQVPIARSTSLICCGVTVGTLWSLGISSGVWIVPILFAPGYECPPHGAAIEYGANRQADYVRRGIVE